MHSCLIPVHNKLAAVFSSREKGPTAKEIADALIWLDLKDIDMEFLYDLIDIAFEAGIHDGVLTYVEGE